MRKKLHTEKLVSLHKILLRHSTTEQEISRPVNKWGVEKCTQNSGRKEDIRKRADISGSGQGTIAGFCNPNSSVSSGSVKLLTDSLHSNISTFNILR